MTDEYGAAHDRRALAAAPVPVTDDHKALALDCIREAFWDDPVVSWFVRNDAKKRDAMALLIGTNMARSIKKDCSFMAADGSAAAIWQAPAPAGPSPTLIDQLKRLPFMWRVCGARRMARLQRLIRVVGPAHPKSPEHYYLHFLGVRPAYQGQGLGSSILEATLERVDAERMPAYLESSNIKNVPLYERHGFRVLKEIDVTPDGPRIWPMWRDAAD